MKNLLARFLVLICFSAESYSGSGEDFFAKLADNTWVHVPTKNNPAHEGHGGMAIDNERGFLYLYGSDTHGDELPDNSIHILNLSTLEWTQSNTPDPLSTYLYESDGWTVTSNGRPWATHVFHNMVFLAELNALLIHTFPSHNYTGIEAAKAGSIAEQSWLYYPGQNQWVALKDSKPPVLWARGISYNPVLDRVVGTNGNETYLFNPKTLIWEGVTSSGKHPGGIETGAGFDTFSEKAFLFAGNFDANSQLTEYDPVNRIWEEVLTTGGPPPDGAGPSIALDSINNVLIYHSVDSSDHFRTNSAGLSETWILDLKTKQWQNMQPAVRPPNYAFTFTMDFSEKYNVALYYSMVAEPGKPAWTGQPELWAYRYKRAEGAIDTTATFSEGGELYIPVAEVNGNYYSAVLNVFDQGGKFMFELASADARNDLGPTDVPGLNGYVTLTGDRLNIPVVNVLGRFYSAELKMLLTQDQKIHFELIGAQPLT